MIPNAITTRISVGQLLNLFNSFIGSFMSNFMSFLLFLEGFYNLILYELLAATSLAAETEASFGQLVRLGFDIAVFTPASYQRHRL